MLQIKGNPFNRKMPQARSLLNMESVAVSPSDKQIPLAFCPTMGHKALELCGSKQAVLELQDPAESPGWAVKSPYLKGWLKPSDA